MTHPRRLLLVLTENQTIVDPRDLDGLVQIAVDAEAAGVDGVMMSEHIVLGPSAGTAGVMLNERDYAAPGNQDPATPWPSSLVLLSAIAQATTSLRLVAGAVIAPLRHPLLLARELGTLDLLSHGRLMVLPTVSWHRDEYDALGVAFGERGKILDEQLEVWERAWGPSPFRHGGARFPFGDVWMEPGPERPGGPALWFGGQGMHPPLIQRIVRYGSGVNPFGPLTDDDLDRLATAMTDAGRDFGELELVGGIRGTFRSADDVADLDAALAPLPRQLEQGFSTICFKPAMFVTTADEVGDLCRELVARLDAM